MKHEGSHPLLDRLLRKSGASAESPPLPEAWASLLALVARTFRDADQDRYTLERSIDISSREMQRLYQDLQRSSDSALAFERGRVAESLAVLRATLEATNEGILVVDRERRVVAANARVWEMFDVPAELIEAMYESDAVVHDELALRDGRTLERYSAPVALPDGTLVGRVTFFRDVTEARAAQQAIEHARNEAERANRAKSMFLANMSHELRTPLNAVIGLADLLLLEGVEPVSARQRQYLEGIAQSGRHLLAMVNDILDLAKIEAGRQSLELEHVGTEDAIAEAAALVRPIAVDRGVDLVLDVDPQTPHVRADPIRLRQILVNLIGNAVKFTDRDGHVRVSAGGEHGRVAIRVADTGIGIAPEHLGQLFRPFQQLALPSGDRPPGTGLGLALTKVLVEMHRGAIDVASQLGHGTTFTVHLPED